MFQNWTHWTRAFERLFYTRFSMSGDLVANIRIGYSHLAAAAAAAAYLPARCTPPPPRSGWPQPTKCCQIPTSQVGHRLRGMPQWWRLTDWQAERILLCYLTPPNRKEHPELTAPAGPAPSAALTAWTATGSVAGVLVQVPALTAACSWGSMSQGWSHWTETVSAADEGLMQVPALLAASACYWGSLSQGWSCWTGTVSAAESGHVLPFNPELHLDHASASAPALIPAPAPASAPAPAPAPAVSSEPSQPAPSPQTS